jgi:multisubunit Na+/H+ antiporter MnhC subunit
VFPGCWTGPIRPRRTDDAKDEVQTEVAVVLVLVDTVVGYAVVVLVLVMVIVYDEDDENGSLPSTRSVRLHRTTA